MHICPNVAIAPITPICSHWPVLAWLSVGITSTGNTASATHSNSSAPSPEKRFVVTMSSTADKRLVTIWNAAKNKEMEFLTNNLKLGATTISGIYKERWNIEIFFKALKQLMRVRTFVGTSANALKTQIWTALIAMLLFKYLQMQSQRNWSLSNLVALVRQQLFVYRGLMDLLDQQLGPPPVLDWIHDGQLALDFAVSF